jgi:hypothetical protein
MHYSLEMDLFDTLTWAEILVKTTFLGTPTLTVLCSYKVGIGRAWCSWKACKICSSLVQKKKLKKIHFSSHKLPKQQSISFWFQGILVVKFWKKILSLDEFKNCM